jgi:hypothetical protein
LGVRSFTDGGDVGIVDDIMRIVEIEVIVEVVGIDQQQGGEEKRD